MMLKDKVIIVTGGSGLIGRAIMADIKQRGGCAINADIDVQTDLECCMIKTDISSDSSIHETVNQVLEEYHRIDGLVNNAYPRTHDWSAKFEDISPDSWRKNVDLQLNSYFVFCQKVLCEMSKQNNGSIVNIGSIYGIVGNDFTIYEKYGGTSPAAYAAIKGGLISLTRYLASYYGRRGIRVNCVSPGGIEDKKRQDPSFIKRYCQKVPMGRLGRPDDIAPAVSFLLSDDSRYITGHNLVVDGGWTAI